MVQRHLHQSMIPDSTGTGTGATSVPSIQRNGKTRSKKEKSGKGADEQKTTHPKRSWSRAPSPRHGKLVAHHGNRSMIMERKLGAGSVVICTDSYFASNEALWKDPKAKFLAWLIGDAHRVIFDETHLGSNIGDEDNLMVLARRYRMHPDFSSARCCSLSFYVWRNRRQPRCRRMQPKISATGVMHAVAGQSAAAGLEGLAAPRPAPQTGSETARPLKLGTCAPLPKQRTWCLASGAAASKASQRPQDRKRWA